MNFLTKALPEYFKHNGRLFYFNTDFKTWIEFEILMTDKDIPADIQINTAIELCFKDGLDILGYMGYDVAVEKMMWFYACGQELKEADPEVEEKQTKKDKQVYSYEHDGEYIYAAFLKTFKIDILDTPIHWWKFKALFNALDESCMFVKIMGFRTIKLDKDMGKKEKAYYKKMKRLYALPDTRTEAEKEADFANALMGGFFK